MTKLGICGLLTFSPSHSQQGSSLATLGLRAIVGIIFLFCTGAAITAPAQSPFFTSLVSFDGRDGTSPYAALVQGSDGNFYGTGTGGGIGDSFCYGGCGTAFKITPAGVLTIIHNFGRGGSYPQGGLVQSTDGNFYGTTYLADGGATGTVFKLTPEGLLTTLYTFCSQPNCTDGTGPRAGLVQATDGNFYGTTLGGGTYGSGTVFKVTSEGMLTTLYSFCPSGLPCPDGANPEAAVVQASDGNFYGTTSQGADGYGTIFKMTPSGALTTLYSFSAQSDCPYGCGPNALLQARDGNFYGTTAAGGANHCGVYSCGTVFKITPTGTLTTLHSFDGTDGWDPLAGLIQATDGSLYGTTYYGGPSSSGTAFKITLAGVLTTLHGFCASGPPCTDGAVPHAALVQAGDGNFYGATVAGGAYGYGTLFRLDTVGPCPACRP